MHRTISGNWRFPSQCPYLFFIIVVAYKLQTGRGANSAFFALVNDLVLYDRCILRNMPGFEYKVVVVNARAAGMVLIEPAIIVERGIVGAAGVI